MNAEDLITILRQGEGTRIEFKSDFPAQSHAIAKEMAAFANSGGGVLLMGVTDDGAPIGIDNADRVVERLAGIAHTCGLSISPEIDKFQVSKNVFVVYAKIRACPPCFYEGKIYHRVGSTSVECRSSEQLENILATRSRPEFSQPSPFGNSHPGLAPLRSAGTSRRWSGYWFVNVGEGAHRNWDDNRRYGFLSAGQGPKYSRALRILPVGAKIFAYLSRWGYVGYGEVNQEAIPIKDFIVDTEQKRLLDLPLIQERVGENSNNPELCEWIIGIRWGVTFPRDRAKSLKGVPTYRNIVCKLAHPTIIEFLEREFEIKETNPANGVSLILEGHQKLGYKSHQSHRSRQDEISFFEAMKTNGSSATDIGTARKLLMWSKEKFSEINWGAASFSPVFHYGGESSFNPISVYTSAKPNLNARIKLRFPRMTQKNPPFGSAQKRLEFLKQLNEIAGIDLPSESIDHASLIPLTPLANDDSMRRFQSVIEWAIKQVTPSK